MAERAPDVVRERIGDTRAHGRAMCRARAARARDLAVLLRPAVIAEA
jgi:hypothetical protein